MTKDDAVSQTISICGVMAQVHPNKIDEVKRSMLTIAGLEIHDVGENGKLVITIESDSYKETGRRITTLQKLKGVLSASMIYQHTDSLSQ